jgi:hypothetical protein
MKHSRDLAASIKEELPTIRAQVALRGCPFCCSSTLRAVRAMQESGDLGDFTIECQICLGVGPPGATLEEAGLRWNLRG